MRIGILLTGDYTWAGGLYYSLNLIKLLHKISLSKKLQIVVIINGATPKDILNEIPKENIKIVNLDKKTIFYKFYHKYFGDRFLADFNNLKLDILYPLINYEERHKKLNCKVYYWVYDLQHLFLPNLFLKQEIYKRDGNFAEIAYYTDNVICSSNNAKKHFLEGYTQNHAKVHVFQFVSLIQIPKEIKINQIVPDKYFIVCNQFWHHKNHLIVLRALYALRELGMKVNVVFTGKLNYEGYQEHTDKLLTYVERNKLQDQVTFTDFISREDQIQLMNKALAVIQPSLFEGWSTVIEDAKALNKFVIASDIEINREQIDDYVMFFDPKNHIELATLMAEAYSGGEIICDFIYKRNIDRALEQIKSMFNIQ